MEFTYAKDDIDWQAQVLSKCDGRCSWPGCNSTWGVAGHHIFDRRRIELRLVVENGVRLCAKHHQVIQTSGNRRERMSILLVGKRMYSELNLVLEGS